MRPARLTSAPRPCLIHAPVEKTSLQPRHRLSPHPPLPLHSWAVVNVGHYIVEQSHRRGHHAMSCRPRTMLDIPPFSARRSPFGACPHYTSASHLGHPGTYRAKEDDLASRKPRSNFDDGDARSRITRQRSWNQHHLEGAEIQGQYVEAED